MKHMKVVKVGIRKAKNLLYFVDRRGDIAAVHPQSKKKMLIKKVGVKKLPGMIYFVDKQGDISMVKMKRRR